MAKETLTKKELNILVREMVYKALREILKDPDFGLELQEWVKKRLKEKPKKLISLKEVKQKLL